MNNRFTHIRRLRNSGFTESEILAIAGPARDMRFRSGESPREFGESLEAVAQRLLRRKLPTWWHGDAASYQRCVWNNFCDVLEAA